MAAKKPIGFRRVHGRVIPIYERKSNAAKGAAALTTAVGAAYAQGRAERVFDIKSSRQFGKSMRDYISAKQKLTTMHGPLFNWAQKEKIDDIFKATIHKQSARLNTVRRLSKAGRFATAALATYGVAKLYKSVTNDSSDVRPGAVGSVVGAPVAVSSWYYGGYGKRAVPEIKKYLTFAIKKAFKK